MRGFSFIWMIGICVSAAKEIPVPEGRRFRDIVADKYPDGNVWIGGTTSWNKRPYGSGITMDREFSYTTPENPFKQTMVHPSPGIWLWTFADKWVKDSEKEDQVVRMHSPIGPQCSQWAKKDKRTPEELLKILTEFMTALCERYDSQSHVKWMDVVNETVLKNGDWRGPEQGKDVFENPWLNIGVDETDPLGVPLYILKAFEIATEKAPNIELIINQNGDMEDPRWEKIKALVLYLRQRGMRVDGIGWQAHVEVGFEEVPGNMERLDALITWAHQQNLTFHVTEANVWLREAVKDYQAQADTFGAIVRALLEHRDEGVVTWNVWNLSDRDAVENRADLDGSIFDRQYIAKPAYYAIQSELENPPPI